MGLNDLPTLDTISGYIFQEGFSMSEIHTIDLKHLGRSSLIAAFAIPYSGGLILIESGPGSTYQTLEKAIEGLGYSVEAVTDVFVTHIHLDHAGASGRLAREGARIHVHHRGLPHLENPERLLASAGRLYGDQLEYLWGEMLPVPAEKLIPLADGDVTRVGELEIRAVDTPGHATHHMAYQLEDTLFSGDVGGIRMAGKPYLILPMPPPEFHLEYWRASLEKIKHLGIQQIAPTHFGLYQDASTHLAMLGQALADIEQWMEEKMPLEPDVDTLREWIVAWARSRAHDHQLTSEELERYEYANPSWTSAYGIERYWRKNRGGSN
jgi:glyoxylase-like metal-dependent hydrolase (beta-lactamase superfamily II)